MPMDVQPTTWYMMTQKYTLVSKQQRHIELQVQWVSVVSVLDTEKYKQGVKKKSQLHLMPEFPKSLPYII